MLSSTLPEAAVGPKRRQIIEGAALVFNEAGYDGASMSRIAEQAGVSKGTLYNYFDSKSALFAAFVDRETSERIAWIMQSADTAPDVEQFLAGVARRLIDVFLSRSFQTLQRIIVSEAAKFPHLARIYYETGHRRGCAELAAWLSARTREGDLAIDDPFLAAEQFSALCKTRLWMCRMLDVNIHVSVEEIDTIVDASVAMFLNTYRVRATTLTEVPR